MLQHKGTQYKRTLADYDGYLHTLNQINLNTTAQEALHGKRVVDLNVDDMMLQIKTTKAMALPGFQDYLKAGINLTAQVPDCRVTKSCLQEIAELAKRWKMSHTICGISYDKAQGFIINAEGEKMLNDAVVTLNKKQSALYQMIKDVHQTLLDGEIVKFDIKNILSENVVGFSGDKFLDDSLVDAIAKTKF